MNLKANLVKEFLMKDLDPTRIILEMRINREKRDVESIKNRVREEGAEEV